MRSTIHKVRAVFFKTVCPMSTPSPMQEPLVPLGRAMLFARMGPQFSVAYPPAAGK